MNKVLVILSLVGLLAFKATAQDTLAPKQEVKPVGITLQISNPVEDEINIGWFNIDQESIDNYDLKRTSYAVGAVVQYNLNKETALRIRTGITRMSIEEYNPALTIEAGTLIGESHTGRQTKLHLAPGIVWRVGQHKLSFLAGFELPVNLHGVFTSEYVSTITDTISGQVLHRGRSITRLPKGYSFGVAALMGFAYQPLEWLSIGAEFSPALLYARLSGQTATGNDNQLPGAPIVTTPFTQDENKGFTFYQNRFSLNATFWLGR